MEATWSCGITAVLLVFLHHTTAQVGKPYECKTTPPTPANSIGQYFGGATSVVICKKGFELPDGTTSLTLACRNQKWVPDTGNYTSIPDCLEPCNPRCTISQKCYLPQNECHCPDGFKGESCKTVATCPVNEFHKGCADSCKVSCRARAQGQTCKAKCFDGCVCGEGKARNDKDECVPVEKCPCYVNGVEIADGYQKENVNGDQVEVCLCSKQQWKCELVGKGRASIFGERGNIAMFDGTMTTYNSRCQYCVLKDDDFSIVTDEVNGTELLDKHSRSLQINMPGMVVRLLPNKKVTVNAETINSLPYQHFRIKIWHASSVYILARLWNGVEIQWDGETRANVYVPPTFYNITKGLFGNYNIINNEQRLTADGTITRSLSEFVDSWRTDESAQCRAQLDSTADDMCTWELISDDIKNFCIASMKKSPFSVCVEKFGSNVANNYIRACAIDECSKRASKKYDGACLMLSQFSIICKTANPEVNVSNWRTIVPECLPKCQDGQIYHYCRDSCSRDCTSLAINPKCVTECVEGCNCPEGQSLNMNNQCIPSNKCPCMINNNIYHIGAIIVRETTPTTAEKCTCQGINWNCVPQSSATCKGVGESMYSTFDGKSFLFQGRCSYTAVQHKDFSIEVTNRPWYLMGTYGAIADSITIRVNGKKIQLGLDSELKIDNNVARLPWELTGVLRVRKISQNNVVAELFNGVVVTWNALDKSFEVNLPGILYGTVKGLCGTFNGNQSDDFQTPSNKIVESKEEFGKSWQVISTDSCDVLPRKPCDVNPKLAAYAQSVCAADKTFQACIPVVSSYQQYYEACVNDVCSIGNNTGACPHFAAYGRECIQKNIQIDWRKDNEQCRIPCPAGQIYQLCGDSCTRSCRDIALNPGCKPNCADNCNMQCVEGCNCPQGQTLADNGQCVPINQCPCIHNGIQYATGQRATLFDSVKNEYQTCTCGGGRWSCSTLPPAACTGSGDPHYTTFDGKYYHFQGLCNYYLLWHHEVTIQAQNYACAPTVPVSCTESVTAKIGNGIFGTTIKLGKLKQILLNNVEIKVPYQGEKFLIRMRSSAFVEVLFWNGVSLMFDGYTTFILTVPGNFYMKTQGLCGTYNANQRDDFLMSTGDITTSEIIFADSWRAQKSCNGTDTNGTFPCDTNPIQRSFAEQKCKALLGNTFKDCHNVVKVDKYLEACKYDLCTGKLQTQFMCEAFASYAKDCANKGIIIDWRKNITECRINCTSGQVFEVCGNSCTRTCNDLARTTSCTPSCDEGCRCPAGTVLDKNNKCVQPFQCLCEYQGKDYNNGDKIFKIDGNGKVDVCACVSGAWSCKNQGGSRCSVVLETHYETFDKTRYDFSSTCGYVLLEAGNTKVETSGRQCYTDAVLGDCPGSLIIKYNTMKITLSLQNGIHFNGAKINQFPYVLREIVVSKASTDIVSVSLPDGTRVYWNGWRRVYIDVPATFYGFTKGLCGTFNSDPSDDLTTRNGQVVTKMNEFAFSWIVEQTCKELERNQTYCATISSKETALSICKPLRESIFQACHGIVDVRPYLESCIYDVCACQGSQNCRCTMMDTYADVCANKGVIINWKAAMECNPIECPIGQQYQRCGDSCTRTCRDVQQNPTCKSTCVQGCSCPRGQTLNREGVCILLERCPCLHDGKEFAHGEQIIKQNGEKFERCHCGEGRWTCNTQTTGVCSVLDNTYISMFNGYQFSMKSNCEYYLLKLADVSIISSPGQCYPKNTSTCTSNGVVIEYKSSTTVLYGTTKFRYNGIDYAINGIFNQNGVIIRMASSIFVVAQLSNGIDIYWDMKGRIYITVPPTFYGKTEGLCGTYTTMDQLRTRWGIITGNTDTFLQSWQVKQCEVVPPPTNRCTNDTVAKTFAEQQCELLRSRIGRACGETVDVKLHYIRCMKAACENTDSRFSICTFLASYADECAINGIIVNWREFEPKCEITCTNGQTYVRNGQANVRTCQDIATSSQNSLVALEGCFCPQGKILSSSFGACVNITQCSCIYDGKEYKAGESILKTYGTAVEKCSCYAGNWNCEPVREGRCTNLGLAQYTTFDGVRFSCLGNCRYYLARTQHFTVEAELHACDNAPKSATCAKSVTVRSNGLIIDLKQNNEILINSQQVTQFPIKLQSVLIRKVTIQSVVVSLPNGGEVWWDGLSYVRIDVPPTYMDQTEGLCGKYNNNPADDLTTSYGEVSTSLETFVRSWRVNDKCEFTEVLPCESNNAIIQTCSVLNGTLFQPCHGLVDFKPYYEMCVTEMCNSKSNVSYGCSPILSYAVACIKKDVSIPINSLPSTCVPTCPSGQEYQICGDSCSRTCRDISSYLNCKSKCIAGCRCPAGQALNDKNACIPVSKCGCLYKDNKYDPFKQIIKPKEGTNSVCNLEVCICNGARWDCEQAKIEHLDAINSCEEKSYEIITV